MKYAFDIKLTVPLGVRLGTMTFIEQNGVVDGMVKLFGNTTYFTGQLNGNVLKIKGWLKTSVRNIDYEGVGEILNNQLKMQLISLKRNYILEGKLQNTKEQ